MARQMKKGSAKAPSENYSVNEVKSNASVAEIKEWYEKNRSRLERFEEAQDGLKILRDVTKNNARSVSSFSKEAVRGFLQNPTTNERNLRNLSRYLYYRSHIYFRMIKFFANMFCLDCNSVIPEFDVTAGGDANAVLSSFNETHNVLDKMHLQSEFFKGIVMAMREDVAFYVPFYDEEDGLFLMNLDPDYCKIDGQYFTGNFSFSMDMSYWRQRQDILELLGDPLQSAYKASESSGEKWQHIEGGFCLKFRSEDYDIVVPPFSALFENLISLLDLEEIQAISDEQQIYKFLYIPMETMGNDVDDWMITPQTIIEFYNRLLSNGAFPDYTTSGIVPGKEVKSVSFESDATTDSNRLQKAMANILDLSGGGELLLGSNITGSTAFQAAQIANTEFAISSLLPQIEGWVNMFLKSQLSNPCKVKFFPVSSYTKEEYKKGLLESSTYGLPTKLAYNACNGFSAKDTMALNFLEEQCLGLTSLFVPLQSSHTQSGNDNPEGGRPTEEPTSESEDSAEKRDRNN